MKLLLAALTVGVSASYSFDNLITFGDSYTDEGRLLYMLENHKVPPVGLVFPPSKATDVGGYPWSRFVARQTGSASYNYAVSGAMCSDDIIPRKLDAIDMAFPSVLGYELSAFKADVEAAAACDGLSGDSGVDPGQFPNDRQRRANNTVYAVWIGTNDLGTVGFLEDRQRPGKTISDFIDCVWTVFDRLHSAGGRRFVLINQLPLELAPIYAQPGVFGQGNNRFDQDPSSYNVTEFNDKLRQYTTNVNTIFSYGVPYHLRVRERWPGAEFALLDAHSIVADVYANPSLYLDAPANATAPYRRCTPECVDAAEPISSFLWYDFLHPSEKLEEILAKHFIDLVVNGSSKYGTYYHSA